MSGFICVLHLRKWGFDRPNKPPKMSQFVGTRTNIQSWFCITLKNRNFAGDFLKACKPYMLSGWRDLGLVCVLKKKKKYCVFCLKAYLDLSISIINSYSFPWGAGGREKALISHWHLPSGVHILSLPCKLENVYVYDTHESPFQKLSHRSALTFHVYLAFFTVGPKTLKIFCIKLLWGWCLVSLLGFLRFFALYFILWIFSFPS